MITYCGLNSVVVVGLVVDPVAGVVGVVTSGHCVFASLSTTIKLNIYLDYIDNLFGMKSYFRNTILILCIRMNYLNQLQR